MSSITCKCGECKLRFQQKTCLYRLDCCCCDCKANQDYWFTVKGDKSPGPAPDPCILDSLYFPNDFAVEKGLSLLGAFKLSETAKSTRIYCTQCFTILLVDNPFYEAKFVLTTVLNYEGYQGLHDADLMEPQCRIFVKDMTEEERKAARPWKGAPDGVQETVSMKFLADLAEIKASTATGEMNFQKLAEEIGVMICIPQGGQEQAAPAEAKLEPPVQNEKILPFDGDLADALKEASTATRAIQVQINAKRPRFLAGDRVPATDKLEADLEAIKKLFGDPKEASAVFVRVADNAKTVASAEDLDWVIVVNRPDASKAKASSWDGLLASASVNVKEDNNAIRFVMLGVSDPDQLNMADLTEAATKVA